MKIKPIVKVTEDKYFLEADGSAQKAEIVFYNGQFQKCIFSGVVIGNYTLGDWEFLGEVSKFILK